MRSDSLEYGDEDYLNEDQKMQKTFKSRQGKSRGLIKRDNLDYDSQDDDEDLEES